MVRPSIFDVKYNGLDMYETMRQVDRDRMLYDLTQQVQQPTINSTTYKPETKSERYLRYYENVDMYIEGACSDKDWKKIKKAKNINKYKKSYAKLIADEFELEYRGKITMSETQICLIILMIIITICLIPFDLTYVLVGTISTIVVTVLFRMYISIHNDKVTQQLDEIQQEKTELINKMKASK